MNCCRPVEKGAVRPLFLKLAELATQTQTLNQRRVTGNIFTFQVVEQFTTLRNHAQQTTTAVVIFFCALQSGPAGG